MRVIFVTHNYPRFSGDPAGGFLHPLALALRAQGADVRVVAPSDQGRGGQDSLDGVPVRRVRYAASSRERYGYSGTMQSAIRSPAGIVALFALRRALRQGVRAEATGHRAVVHAHWWMPGGWAVPPELPSVLTVHGTDGRLLERSALARQIGRPVVRRARVVTAVSHSLAEGLRQSCGLTEVQVQPMPVDSVDLPWSRGGGGVLLVTRLTRQKRVHLVLEALSVLARRGVPVRTTIVGEGPERGGLETLARALGVAATFTGALPFSEVRHLLGQADLAIQPSVAEGFGLAAAEAIMAGVPAIVCTDGGGLLDIVPADGAGRRVAPRAEAIADGLQQLLADPAAQESARALGVSWRARLDPGQVGIRFAGWYQDALTQ